MSSWTALPPGYEPPAGFFDQWREVGPGVLVRRHRVLDLNITLVLGDERALVVDTHSHAGYAAELVAAVRSVTRLPWVVVDTHGHFDHAFGNATFAAEQPGLEIWGHERCRDNLEQYGELQRRLTAEWMREAGKTADAQAVEQVEILPPNRVFGTEVRLDLGSRTVRLHHPGRGHTDHDVVVDVPDAGVTVAGDLVEEGAPPSFGDAFPLEWPATLDALLVGVQPVVVPGHGDVVDPAFVAEQREALAQVAQVARSLPSDVGDGEVVRAAARLRIGRRAGLEGVRRALALRS